MTQNPFRLVVTANQVLVAVLVSFKASNSFVFGDEEQRQALKRCVLFVELIKPCSEKTKCRVVSFDSESVNFLSQRVQLCTLLSKSPPQTIPEYAFSCV